MKTIGELNFGYKDAVNYRATSAQHLLELFFVEDEQVAEVCKPHISFLVGDKGTGKTACAAFLSGKPGREHYDISGNMIVMQDTDYRRFFDIKQEKQLPDSAYCDLWRVVLLVLLVKRIEETSGIDRLPIKTKAVMQAIDAFFYGAFRPEIQTALEYASAAPDSARGLARLLIPNQEDRPQFSEARNAACLMFVQKKIVEAILEAAPERMDILFVDGIDVRPPGMEYSEYIKCVKGLVNAVWSINNEEFRTRTETCPKIVLLIRPDILDNVGMQNLNNKMRDNAVMLDWQTNYYSYRVSKLFRLAEKMLSSQQLSTSATKEGEFCWDRYFPYKVWNNREQSKIDSSFIPFLRNSFYRPRDIITYLDVMRDRKVELGHAKDSMFTEKDFEDSKVRRKYSEYLLGEIKDSLSFYYASHDYELFLKFFEYLAPKINHETGKFDYQEFLNAYSSLIGHLQKNSMDTPVIFATADKFLQFLYELNIICYLDPVRPTGESQQRQQRDTMHWCFRERSYANIRPKVRTHQIYKMHYGIARALNTTA